jgi:hypothetical protein
MTAIKRGILISTPIVVITCAGLYSTAVARMHSSEYPIDARESTQTKIARAFSAGPKNVTKGATIAEMDNHGHLHVLGIFVVLIGVVALLVVGFLDVVRNLLSRRLFETPSWPNEDDAVPLSQSIHSGSEWSDADAPQA